MTGDVGGLGGYFDDAGANLMHDEWTAPMSRTTRAILDLVRKEAPDIVLNCHSHENVPAMLHTAYAPHAVKEDIAAFAIRLYEAFDRADIPHKAVPEARFDGLRGEVPPALNLTSMLYHTGAALPMTFEAPHGLNDQDGTFSYDQILQIHHTLFETAADWLLSGPLRA
jgi:hypothetical protein